MKTLLVTGGTGFVMSHVVRQWLLRDERARAIVLDIAPPDRAAERFFRPVEDRADFLTSAVEDRSTWTSPILDSVTHLVHGAAMTPIGKTAERLQARRIVEVNIQGTLNALEWARERERLERIVHVSTGSVYADDGPPGALPEDGYEERSPSSLYPITKRAGELLALRYAELFTLPLAAVRLSSVYGPMDRVTPGRDHRCAPNIIAHKALAAEPVQINTPEAVGDFIHAGDVASAILALLHATRLEHTMFNVAYGQTATLADLVAYAAAAVPGARYEVVDESAADIVMDPHRTRGGSGAYDIARLRSLGWRPRPLAEAMADYIIWLRSNPPA